jgi:peptidoglycan hydrolase FlgJ
MIPPISSAIANANASASAGSAGPSSAPPTDPRIKKAAQEFEAIFVRQMLKSVEKTTAAGAGTQATAGENTYGSMVVGALADSISKAGGLGLADVISASLARTLPKPTQ